jgi:hypothetical protein
VSGTEVFQHVQAFTEVCLNGSFDDFAVRFCHQSPHTCELPDLFLTTSRAGDRHQVNRVDVPLFPTAILSVIDFEFLHHLRRDFFTSVSPRVENLVVPFHFGNNTVFVTLPGLFDFLLRVFDDLRLLFRRDEIVRRKGQSALGAFAETRSHQSVEQVNRSSPPDVFVAVADDRLQACRFECVIVIRHSFRQNVVKNNPSRCCLERLALIDFGVGFQPSSF